MQQRDRQDERTVEPVSDIDVRDLALDERAEEHHGIRHPNQGNQNIDRPFQLRVFLTTGKAHRQRDRGKHNHQLPAPKGEAC